jgi:hypothetical protein
MAQMPHSYPQSLLQFKYGLSLLKLVVKFDSQDDGVAAAEPQPQRPLEWICTCLEGMGGLPRGLSPLFSFTCAHLSFCLSPELKQLRGLARSPKDLPASRM